MKLIFLISLPRSGSTLLQRILNGHKNIRTTAEPWLLLPFVYATKKHGTLTKYSHSITHQGIVDLVNLLPGKTDEYNKQLANFVNGVYSSLSGPETIYFLDKTPRYYLILDELYQIFPKAKYIFLFRNPVQIYSSILSTWGNKSFKGLYKYRYYMDLTEGFDILSYAYKNFKGDSFVLQYKNLVGQPLIVLNELLEFLELEGNNNLIDSINEIEVNGRNFDPTMDLHRKLDDKSLEKWETIFNTQYRKSIIRKYIENLNEKSLEIQGYYKEDLIRDIRRLNSKGKYFFLKDIFEYNKARILNRFDRLSYN